MGGLKAYSSAKNIQSTRVALLLSAKQTLAVIFNLFSDFLEFLASPLILKWKMSIDTSLNDHSTTQLQMPDPETEKQDTNPSGNRKKKLFMWVTVFFIKCNLKIGSISESSGLYQQLSPPLLVFSFSITFSHLQAQRQQLLRWFRTAPFCLLKLWVNNLSSMHIYIYQMHKLPMKAFQIFRHGARAPGNEKQTDTKFFPRDYGQLTDVI